MFSYLQSKRPNSRRSAVPRPHSQALFDSSSRDDHDTSDLAKPDQGSPTSSQNNAPSHISSTPPLLPPIPRVASQLRSHSDGPQRGEQDHWSFKGDSAVPGVPPTRSKLSITKRFEDRPRLATRSSERQHPVLNPTEELGQDAGRARRAIDLRFEEMRSRPPQPFHQSIYTQQDELRSIHPAFNPPTPPPKTSPAPLSASSRVPSDPISKVACPRPPESRYRTWNQKVFDHPQPAILEDTAHPESTPSCHQSTQPRQGKPKLNLRNPMALLARRRSHQIVEAAYQENQNSPALQLSPDFDPRIRGKGVHDFNAPRLGRSQVSTFGPDGCHARQREARESTARGQGSRSSSQDREHTPVFKEQFDDGLEKSQDPANRSSAFLQQMAIQASQSQPDPSSMPAFARKLPSKISSDGDEDELQSQQQPLAPLEILVEPPDKDQTPALPSPPMSPPRAASTSASLSDQTSQGLGSPKRYTSNASRFSFDLAGVGSAAQEKLLEDKHRQKAQRKQQQSDLSDDDMIGNELDMSYDAMEDGGYEERIPGVNCNDDDDGDATANQRTMPVLQRNMETFNLVSPNKSSFESTASPGSTGVTSLYTPRDIGAQPANFASSKSSPNLARRRSNTNEEGANPTRHGRPKSTPGGSWTAPPTAQPFQREVASESNLAGLPQRESFLDDDLYFDDGMIDDLGETSDQDFDEDVFDDTSHGLYGLPLRDRTLKPFPEPEIVPGSELGITSPESLELTALDRTPSPHRSISSGGVSTELRDALTELNQPSRPVFSHTAGLTQDNLAAYNHNALSMAINQAAADGAFDRTLSLHDLPPSILATGAGEDQSHETSRMDTGLVGSPKAEAYVDDYGDNDGLDDDAIVAAANAEALENDDDGFYGQEFGFYARASGSTDSEYANGGYFGPKALETLHRSFSGKSNFQEPSLTPITERSEWSNRNSAIYGGMSGYPASAASSQFAGVSQDDLNKQLAMLQKFRRGAWGGSDGSLQSSSNSQNSGSPMTCVAPGGGFIFPGQIQASNSTSNLQNMTSSLNSFNSSNDSDPSPSVDSPTVTLASMLPASTQSAPQSYPPSYSMPPPPLPPALHEPGARTSKAKGHGHSRNNSGAESVSYIEEGGKWVIEKRRMSETGEQMILGRSVVEGGRI